MKLPAVIQCDIDSKDRVEIESTFGAVVAIYAYRGDPLVTSVHMSAAKARRLAKALKKAAKRAEAGR